MLMFWTMFIICGLPLISSYYQLSCKKRQPSIIKEYAFLDKISIRSFQSIEDNVEWYYTAEIFSFYVIVTSLVHVHLYFFQERVDELRYTFGRQSKSEMDV